MVRQYVLLAKAMQAFIFHRLGGGEELCSRLKWVETNLDVAQKAAAKRVDALKLVEGERDVFRAKADKLKKEGETAEAKLKGAKQKNSQLKREVEELQARFSSQNK